MITKQQLSALLRSMHLAFASDKVRYYLLRLKNLRRNLTFKKQFTDVVLPPDYLMYESFQLDYYKYYIGGKEDAQWVVDIIKPYISLEDLNILDWGCGPGRIVRHLPEILGPTNFYYGSDYNLKTIEWCKNSIPDVSFFVNKIEPPLPFPESYFSFIYGISVLTHLSKINQNYWATELHRLSIPGGVVLLTTHGEAFLDKLTNKEIEQFTNNKLVSRGRVLEGHRMYGAFHPPKYIRQVFESSGFKVLDHIPGKRINKTFISQDLWILKKH